MSLPITTGSAFSNEVRTLAKNQQRNQSEPMGQQVSEFAKVKNADKLPVSIADTTKKQLNAAILQSTIEFDETIAAKPLSLLLKTALQGINEALKELGVATAIEESYDTGIDFSPEATAERIVSFSTQFFTLYQDQHLDMDATTTLSSFIETISSGISQGFSEARDVLAGLNVLEGDIAGNIDKTYELVQEGLVAFVKTFDEESLAGEGTTASGL